MTKALPIVFAALSILTACNGSSSGTPADQTQANTAAAEPAKPIELPPMMTASKTYRCADASVVYVDFFSDTKTANIRTDKQAPIVQLKAPEAGQAYTAEGGYSISGKAEDPRIEIGVPGKKAQSCKA